MTRLDGRVALGDGCPRAMGQALPRVPARKRARGVIGDVRDAAGAAVADQVGNGASLAGIGVGD
jgi:hypothetical protein